MGNSKKIIIAAIGIVLVLGFFVLLRSSRIKSIAFSKIDTVTENNSYTIFYSGTMNKDVERDLKELKKKNNLQIYILTDDRSTIVNFVKSKNGLLEPQGDIYLVYEKSKYLGYIDNTMDRTEYLMKYIEGYIPAAERMYKTATGDEYAKLFNSKDKIITVFGEDECSYCKKLEKVVNEVSKKGTYNIYYMNFSRMSQGDQDKIYALNISIPKECTKDKIEDRPLDDGYSKPTTIVSKNGKIIGCIKGYYDYNVYVDKLKAIMEG